MVSSDPPCWSELLAVPSCLWLFWPQHLRPSLLLAQTKAVPQESWATSASFHSVPRSNSGRPAGVVSRVAPLETLSPYPSHGPPAPQHLTLPDEVVAHVKLRPPHQAPPTPARGRLIR
eukprot:scaffold161490_cov33-Prasinocladus_malaysianus.AAC.1